MWSSSKIEEDYAGDFRHTREDKDIYMIMKSYLMQIEVCYTYEYMHTLMVASSIHCFILSILEWKILLIIDAVLVLKCSKNHFVHIVAEWI